MNGSDAEEEDDEIHPIQPIENYLLVAYVVILVLLSKSGIKSLFVVVDRWLIKYSNQDMALCDEPEIIERRGSPTCKPFNASNLTSKVAQ